MALGRYHHLRLQSVYLALSVVFIKSILALVGKVYMKPGRLLTR